MPEGPVPDRHHGSGSDRIVEKLLLQTLHRKIHRQAGVANGHRRRQSCSLADVEDQWLQPGGAIGHVADAETLVRHQQVRNRIAEQRLKRDAEGCSGPASAPANAFRSKGPVLAWVVMIIGVGANGDAAAAAILINWNGAMADPCRKGQQIPFRDGATTDQTSTFTPVRHQSQAGIIPRESLA